MNLVDITSSLPNELDDRLCILAVKPWSASSPAVAVRLDEQFKPPQVILDSGFAYFLEVSIAIEVLGVFGDKQPSAREKLDLLLFYAEHDSFPDWVYSD